MSELSNVDFDRTFDRLADLANSRVGKIITYTIATVACIYLSGHILHLLAGFVVGLKTFVSAIRTPI